MLVLLVCSLGCGRASLAPDGNLDPYTALDAGSALPEAGPAVAPDPLTIELAPGSPCAAWLPARPPEFIPAPHGGPWIDLATDELGDLAAAPALANAAMEIFPADGGVAQSHASWLGRPVPGAIGILWVNSIHYAGACMICDWTDFTARPSGSLMLETDHADYFPRPRGGVVVRSLGMYFSVYDDRLACVAGMSYGIPIAIDRSDRLIGQSSATPGSLVWMDVAGAPLSGPFDAAANGAMPLLPDGLLTTDDVVLRSGSDQPRPAPEWLKGRARGRSFIVFGERAYAFTTATSCAAEIYDAAGDRCGVLRFAACSAPPTFGVDGTAILQVEGSWKLWPQLLR